MVLLIQQSGCRYSTRLLAINAMVNHQVAVGRRLCPDISIVERIGRCDKLLILTVALDPAISIVSQPWHRVRLTVGSLERILSASRQYGRIHPHLHGGLLSNRFHRRNIIAR